MRRGGAWIRLVVVALCSLSPPGCGGGAETAPAADGGASSSPAQATTAPAVRNRCQLTGAHVSAALGVPLNGPDSTCGFYPGDDRTVRPNVLYVAQVTFACSGNNPAEVGYTERLDGLGMTAYITNRGAKAAVLVCREGDPFEIEVDAAGDGVARKAAVALARSVLGK